MEAGLVSGGGTVDGGAATLDAWPPVAEEPVWVEELPDAEFDVGFVFDDEWLPAVLLLLVLSGNGPW